MVLGFEDAFTDVQADYVSLCLKLTGDKTDKIYIFIYQGRDMRTFNVFFRSGDNILFADDLAESHVVDSLYDIGIKDIDKLISVCAQYEHKCPNEIKLTYDVRSSQFDAEYVYEDYMLKDIFPNSVFDQWIDKEEQA